MNSGFKSAASGLGHCSCAPAGIPACLAGAVETGIAMKTRAAVSPSLRAVTVLQQVEPFATDRFIDGLRRRQLTKARGVNIWYGLSRIKPRTLKGASDLVCSGNCGTSAR